MLQRRYFEWRGHAYEVLIRNCHCCSFSGSDFPVRAFVESILYSDNDIKGRSEIACADRCADVLEQISNKIPGGVGIVKTFWDNVSSNAVHTGIANNSRSWIRHDDLNAIINLLMKCRACERKLELHELFSRFGLSWDYLSEDCIFKILWPMSKRHNGWQNAWIVSKHFAGVVCSDMCAAALATRSLEAAKRKLRSERQWEKAKEMYEQAKKLIKERYRGACQ